MASAIHHGAPGSFKSFAVVQRFAIPALEAGRVVITNIRGFNCLDTIKAVFPERTFPDTARLIFFDTGTRDARMTMACWYRWIPVGAMVIIDETQTIYPDRIDFKLEHLDKFVLPEMPDFIIQDTFQTIGEHRPPDVFTAFDKQRHYNWDIFLTTTNVSKIKRDIRESSEWAYRHRSLSEISRFFKGTWYEHQHDPENNGKSASHRLGKPKKYKADQRVFACYQSTATGDHVASQAGTKLLDDNGIKIRLYALLLVIVGFLYLLTTQFNKPAVASIASTTPVVSKTGVKPVNDTTAFPAQVPLAPNNPLSTVQVRPLPATDISETWRVSGRVTNKKTGKTIVILMDISLHTHLIPLHACAEDVFKQLTCEFQGKKVTAYSGTPEKKDSHPVLASTISNNK